MFLGGLVGRVDQRHRLQVIPPADLRFLTGSDGRHQLRHRSFERVREPSLLPLRLEPVAGTRLRAELQRARGMVRILRPADGPPRHSLQTFDAPFDVDIRLPAFARRAGPHVVERRAAQTAFVVQDVERDAVLVRELGARISADAAIDALRIAKQEPERVQVVDAHDPQREPAHVLLPRHPVRDGAHLDGGQHRFAEHPTLQQCLQRPNRLVIAHVLVDAERNARRFVGAHDRRRLPRVHGQRLLRQDSLQIWLPLLDDLQQDLRLLVRRHRHVDNFNLLVLKQLAPVVVDLLHAPRRRDLLCPLPRSRGDGHAPVAGVFIRQQMAIPHDEAGANRADAVVALRRLMGQVVEIEVQIRWRHLTRPASASRA